VFATSIPPDRGNFWRKNDVSKNGAKFSVVVTAMPAKSCDDAADETRKKAHVEIQKSSGLALFPCESLRLRQRYQEWT